MSGVEVILGLVSLASLVVGGYGIFRSRQTAKRLAAIFESGTIEDTDALIEAYAQRFKSLDSKLERSFTRLSEHDKLLSHAVQKVCVKRFNPFDDMGGESSFVLALLDQENTGILVTSITMRDGTRVYAKHIEKGVSTLNLSDEETALLTQTIKQ